MTVISRSPATNEVLVSCECGDQWWEEVGGEQDDDDVKEAA